MGIFGIIMTIILVVAAIVIIIAVLWTLFSDIWSNESEDIDRVENAKLDFMDVCVGTSQCMLTASADPSAHLECVVLEAENRCLVNEIDNCSEFVGDARGAEFTECVSCDSGYILLDGRCHAAFHCSSGTYEVKDGIPGCY
jgi:hypothetical protein